MEPRGHSDGGAKLVSSTSERPSASGKFLWRGGRKLHVCGVTYGTFGYEGQDSGYPDPATVDRDFAQMAASGVNALRTYTVPPRWLLDLAEKQGLLVMVGLAWEQHVAFLDLRGRRHEIERRLRRGVRSCGGHPALLCYSVGNEIPAPIVRWHGRRRVERYLKQLYGAAKEEDPGALVTYVNYPSTEYLDLSFVDFLCFNVYLEDRTRLRSYLARLHNLAGERPLVMAEIGLDSRRNGENIQADVLKWQVATAFEAGCAGAFVFAWTDEWYITYLGADGNGLGGSEITDWDFGLTDRSRRPKPALAEVSRAFATAPLADHAKWPRISVVVCSYNGEATLRECCEGLTSLDYPNFEVIVVDDGSTDATAAIAAEYGFCVISTENRGLSSARNSGWRAATGEIVAYIDDDAWPDRDWLKYLAASFRESDHAGIGGPNVPAPDDGVTARCVALAPGNPNHVLLSDHEAEHLPGCNFAFRREALADVGGFDPRFWAAGDDVDLCWRIRERGSTLGFSPAAMVWHRRRSSLRAYWRQQRGYGVAEALLEAKWPQRYNAAGHLAWEGRIYGMGLVRALRRRGHIYHGRLGSAPFQSLYEQPTGALAVLPSTPEWYLVIALLAGFSALGAIWTPLLAFLPLLVASVGALLGHALVSAARARPPAVPGRTGLRARGLVALLFLLQPLARLSGRLEHGLTPWRRRGEAPLAIPWPSSTSIWSEHWRSGDERLDDIRARLGKNQATVLSGGDPDDWELEVRGGMLGWARMRMVTEEHGAGRQLTRFRAYPRLSPAALTASAGIAVLCSLAAVGGALAASATLAVAALGLVARAALDAAHAVGQLATAIAPEAEAEVRSETVTEPGPGLAARATLDAAHTVGQLAAAIAPEAEVRSLTVTEPGKVQAT